MYKKVVSHVSNHYLVMEGVKIPEQLLKCIYLLLWLHKLFWNMFCFFHSFFPSTKYDCHLLFFFSGFSDPLIWDLKREKKSITSYTNKICNFIFIHLKKIALLFFSVFLAKNIMSTFRSIQTLNETENVQWNGRIDKTWGTLWTYNNGNNRKGSPSTSCPINCSGRYQEYTTTPAIR